MKFLLLLIVPLFLFSQEKGYIDMHGGKKDSLVNQQSNFSNFSSLGGSVLNKPESKKDEKKESKKKKEKGYK